ncbi:Stress-induced-phosphoprotein 1 [Armadillidium nasatum]|uniref:Stress-induced-phosphoprotein 1 n=1 Tax=Armadillidium nasatum TaxID=96803 RepID=A0A5N5SIY6_9CRUS|nr:Stress-induced-phosphoprotein 1 [Armadillidium nasatum]
MCTGTNSKTFASLMCQFTDKRWKKFEHLANQVLELKAKGNECVKTGNYAEAVLHYTHAIKLNENIPQLYSNRSHAFLKLQHFYYALQDAKEAIRLDPTWYKAYYRQGEVEFAAKHYTEALQSYQKASQIYPDPTLLECVLRTSKEYQKQEKHPVIQVIITIALSLAGLIIGKGYKWYIISQRNSLLEPPVDLLGETELKEEESTEKEPTNDIGEKKSPHRYTKAQARQRFRKGKK